jgi:plasmid stabilization system protein ParE
MHIAIDNPRAALRIDDLLAAAAAGLRDFPRLGRPGLLAGTREIFPHKNYRLTYEIRGEMVWIVSVMHTARQWPPEPDGLS